MVTAARKWMSVSLLATLVIGVGAGVLVDRLLLMPLVYSSTRDVAPRGRDHRGHGRQMMERLRAELDLSDAQAEAVSEVMDKNHETAQRFWKESREEFDSLRAQFRRDFREVLTDAQNERFDEIVAERDRKHGGRRRE